MLRQWSLGQCCWWTPRVDGMVDGGLNLWKLSLEIAERNQNHVWLVSLKLWSVLVWCQQTPKMLLQIDYIVFVYITQMKYTNKLLTKDKLILVLVALIEWLFQKNWQLQVFYWGWWLAWCPSVRMIIFHVLMQSFGPPPPPYPWLHNKCTTCNLYV